MCDTLESLNELKGVYHVQKKSTQRHLFARAAHLSAAAHPGRHNPFGACKKGMSAKLESHLTNAIHVIALVGFD